jgi:WD40 repeat protein
MNGAAIVQSGVTANPGSSWQVQGTGNFFGGGNTDIVLQNQDGTVAVWNMDGTTIAHAGVVANPGQAWHVKGTGDFYGDGHSDILLQNTDGTVAMWDMNGSTIMQAGVVTANPGPAWHIEATGDFNADGKTDIVFQNDDGSIATWNMNGATIAGSGIVAPPGTTLHPLGAAENMRFIYSAAADETLAATPTTPDQFVFTNFAAGAHTIAGFSATQDLIQFTTAQFADFAAVQAATTATADGAVITLGNASSLLLPGVDARSLHASNFALT